MGIVFYVLGWIIGTLLKAVYYTVKFIVMALYAGSKRDQLNRRLRLALKKIESDDAQSRAFGREELRHIAAGVGLTNSRWHKNVKVRRRIFEALKTAKEAAVENGELNQMQASEWIDEASGILFANFDRDLLTAEVKPKRRRRFLRRDSSEQPTENFSEKLSKVLKRRSDQQIVPKQQTSNNQATNFDTAQLDSNHPNLELKLNIPNVQATNWANDEELALREE